MTSTNDGGVARIGTVNDRIPTEKLGSDSTDAVAGWVQFGAIEGAAVGIWEHSVGTSGDAEEDEIFIVLSGRATVTEEGRDPVDFGPGDVGRLTAGARTTWVVHETLRKVWVAPDDTPSDTTGPVSSGE